MDDQKGSTMSEGTCEIEGCDKPRYQTRPMCSTHTMRKHRYGDPHADKQRRRGVCQVHGCGKPHSAQGWCKEHYDRYLRTGDPCTVFVPREDITYAGAHDRVTAQRGRASQHQCDCGQPAQEWAYDHQDLNERTERLGRYLVPYSTKPDHYKPMCILCHRRFDLRRTGHIA